jgi:hypothetical protein
VVYLVATKKAVDYLLHTQSTDMSKDNGPAAATTPPGGDGLSDTIVLYGVPVLALSQDTDMRQYLLPPLRRIVDAFEAAYGRKGEAKGSVTLTTLVRMCEMFAQQVDREGEMIDPEARSAMFYAVMYLGMLSARKDIQGTVVNDAAAIFSYMLKCLCSPELASGRT